MQNSLRSFCLAYFVVYYIHGGEDGYQYPAYGRAQTYQWEWMWPILARNLIATFLICMTWDYILYLSPLAPIFKPYKTVEEYPSLS